MKLWVDDVRPKPSHDYRHVFSVESAKKMIVDMENTVDEINQMDFPDWHMCMVRRDNEIELIDIDHDAGEYANDGGDYIELLNWLEETGRNYPIRIHSMNPVGKENMRRIIQRNGWTEVM